MADLFDYMAAPVVRRPTTQELALEGAQRAVDHADAVEVGWSERAYQMLLDYAADHFEFMTENVRVWAHAEGLPTPPDGRAWGAVTLRAVRSKAIFRDHYRKTRIPPAHACDRPVWRSPLYRQRQAA